MTVTVAEAQARLPDLLAGLRPGETLTLTQDDRPVAELVGKAPPAPPGRRPPNLKLRAALAEALAVCPQTPTLTGSDYLREGYESGEIYDYVEPTDPRSAAEEPLVVVVVADPEPDEPVVTFPG